MKFFSLLLFTLLSITCFGSERFIAKKGHTNPDESRCFLDGRWTVVDTDTNYNTDESSCYSKKADAVRLANELNDLKDGPNAGQADSIAVVCNHLFEGTSIHADDQKKVTIFNTLKTIGCFK